jgi:hypothetical protein
MEIDQALFLFIPLVPCTRGIVHPLLLALSNNIKDPPGGFAIPPEALNDTFRNHVLPAPERVCCR